MQVSTKSVTQVKKPQHHMLREILEEPTVLEATIKAEAKTARKIAQAVKSEGYEMFYITGSGTSYHAGLASQYAMSKLTNFSTSILPASEFQRWVPLKVRRKVLLIAISQSGESSDIIEASEAAISRGMTLLAITNTRKSRLAKMSKYQLIPRSGKEKAVPATKTYVTQLMSIFMFAVELAKENLSTEMLSQTRNELFSAPQLVNQTLEFLSPQIQKLAEKYKQKNVIFILGSGPNYATALEAALKLKETCMVFAEGFATREFLHGPMRLVDERTLIIMLVSPDELETELELCRSLRSFGAPVVLITEKDVSCAGLFEAADDVVLAPSGLPEVFSPLLYVVPIQLFAYYNSVLRGLNPDKPEKLTKVVR
ncbi:SIS domain-containing protein [Candidatus Bathyarchaeota archaeon]|nr:SIS domain-containing protein [Candidatus Bathyarchaeota archaeon]